MKTVENKDKKKHPLDIMDPSLDALDKMSLFPEKVKKAKEIIAKYGLPKGSKSED